MAELRPILLSAEPEIVAEAYAAIEARLWWLLRNRAVEYNERGLRLMRLAIFAAKLEQRGD